MREFIDRLMGAAVLGFIVGAFLGFLVAAKGVSAIEADLTARLVDQQSLEQQCIDGKEGACRVLEARR